MNDKIEKYLNDEKYMDKLLSSCDQNNEIRNISITLDGKPEAYARPRVVRGGHAYNPKAKQMDETNKKLKKSLSTDDKNFIENLLKDANADYYVKISLDYYIPISKNSSIKDTILKEKGFIRPTTRPDIDNYDKFIIDTLHNVLFDDDKRIIDLHSKKYYSLTPRTEINAEIIWNK